MAALLLGLVVFLGVHSVRIAADGWRTATIARMGEGPWKGVYSLLSIAGFALLVWGYGQARQAPVVLWSPPLAMKHVTALLMLPAFVLLAAAYVPGNGIQRRLQHPMVLSVKVWAAAHLLSNGTLADVLLFGGFLVWAVLDFRSARRRGGPSPQPSPRGGEGVKTGIAVVAGVVAYAVFALWLHAALIGVRPY